MWRMILESLLLALAVDGYDETTEVSCYGKILPASVQLHNML